MTHVGRPLTHLTSFHFNLDPGALLRITTGDEIGFHFHFSIACVAWRFCRAGRRRGVATKNSRAKRARKSGEAARKIKTACPVFQVSPAPISSRFLCPRPPLLLSSPNQNRHATQANFSIMCRSEVKSPKTSTNCKKVFKRVTFKSCFLIELCKKRNRKYISSFALFLKILLLQI